MLLVVVKLAKISQKAIKSPSMLFIIYCYPAIEAARSPCQLLLMTYDPVQTVMWAYGRSSCGS